MRAPFALEVSMPYWLSCRDALRELQRLDCHVWRDEEWRIDPPAGSGLRRLRVHHGRRDATAEMMKAVTRLRAARGLARQL
jgi:hypothetical protein